MAMASLGFGLGYLDDVRSESITILVGTFPEPIRFVAPRALLCAKSKWFETALNNFKEGQDGVVHLPEEIPRAFARFLNWLYRDNCALPEVQDASKDEVANRSDLVQECIEIWNLEDMLVLPAFQNIAVVRICLYLLDESWTPRLSIEAQAAAFAETKPHSPLRKLMADYVVQDMQRTGDYTIQKFLGDHEGSLEALLVAQMTAHTSVKGDFPRFKKPHKHRGWVYNPIDDNDDHGYDLLAHCFDCGFDANTTPLCKSCKHQKCGCAGEPEWLFLCEDCIGDHAE